MQRNLNSPFWEGLAKTLGLFWFVLIGGLLTSVVRLAPVGSDDYATMGIVALVAIGACAVIAWWRP